MIKRLMVHAVPFNSEKGRSPECNESLLPARSAALDGAESIIRVQDRNLVWCVHMIADEGVAVDSDSGLLAEMLVGMMPDAVRLADATQQVRKLDPRHDALSNGGGFPHADVHVHVAPACGTNPNDPHHNSCYVYPDGSEVSDSVRADGKYNCKHVYE